MTYNQIFARSLVYAKRELPCEDFSGFVLRDRTIVGTGSKPAFLLLNQVFVCYCFAYSVLPHVVGR